VSFIKFIFILDLDILLNKKHPPTRQRRQRTNFTDETIQALDVHFNQNPYPDIYERECLAKQFNTTEDRIQVIIFFIRYFLKDFLIN
jgi:hypothetical protein